MFNVQIKALSVNQCWQGKRYKTSLYKNYEQELLLKLPANITFDKDNIKLDIIVGFSNKTSDLDNILKPFLDILQKKYNFNDKNITSIYIVKSYAQKGDEFIKFKIT